MHHFDGYTAVEVRDPWDSTRLLQRYLLVDRDRPVPENLPKGTVVQVPAQNVVVYTSVHAAIIDQLGETGRIIGVCEPRYMDTPAIREGLKAGRIADMGEATAPNVEMMIDKGAELVIVSPFQNSGYGPVEKLGIPIIVYCEYLYLDVRKLATQAGADKKLVTMDETHPALASNEPGADRSWEVRCLA